MKDSKSLFSRLFWSVAISELIIFLIVGFFSYYSVKELFIINNKHQNEALENEIAGILDFQDFNLSAIERVLNRRLELASWEMVELILPVTESIEKADLLKMMPELNLDSENEFINIIDTNGIVINSSQTRNLNQKLSDFGEDFERFIIDRFQQKNFYSDGFELDAENRSLHKWSYQVSTDGKYLIQIGVHSQEGSKVASQVKNSINKINKNRKSLISIDIFVNKNQPFSFASNTNLNDEDLDIIISVFADQQSRRIEEEVNNELISKEYLFSERKGSNLYESLVVRIVKDKSIEESTLRNNLYRKAGLFAMGLLILFIVLVINTNLITQPIEAVSNAATNLGSGNLKQRVPVLGSREIQNLAMSFNKMATDLQSSYEQIQNQKAKIERAHKDIQDSITYAKRIQAAILPPDRLVKEYFQNSFILYKPKAIVAGDFYWMDRKDDILFFAAADCTGHGVPGAMISVVCHSALNRSVREYGFTDPSDILAKTRDIVLQEFERSDDEVQDGMDVAFCALRGYELKYAGAQRPLFIVRGDEIIEFKGDRQPIGWSRHQGPFTTHHISLQSNDTLYLFTDGLTDQFGGEHGKKFLINRLKELLLSIRNEGFHLHKSLIDKHFEEWRGNEDQIDDVCVIGVRIT